MLGLTLLFAMGSCTNRSIMFRTGLNYKYNDLNELKVNTEYKIGINDELQIEVNANNGAMVLEGNGNTGSNIEVIVDYDGTLKLPLLGRVNVAGLTLNESELLFEELYKQYIVDPFVKISIMNKRVLFFSGSGGATKVIILRNKNTTLFEAMASIGGISNNGKAHKIKIFRKGKDGQTRVYKVNLAKIEYLQDGEIILQGNDVVYIEPRDDIFLNFGQRVAPYFFLLNIYFIANTLIN